MEFTSSEQNQSLDRTEFIDDAVENITQLIFRDDNCKDISNLFQETVSRHYDSREGDIKHTSFTQYPTALTELSMYNQFLFFFFS